MLERSFSIAAASPKPLMTTLQPSLAKALAIARPMPLVDPVTSATLPLSIRFSPTGRAASCGAAMTDECHGRVKINDDLRVRPPVSRACRLRALKRHHGNHSAGAGQTQVGARPRRRHEPHRPAGLAAGAVRARRAGA